MKCLPFLLLVHAANLVCARTKWENYIEPELTISCAAIKNDFLRGQQVFEMEDDKGEFLARNGYTSSLEEPFAELFLNAPPSRNMTPQFYCANRNLRGIQQVVDQFSKWHTGIPQSEQVKITDYLNEASNCIAQCNYETKRSVYCDPNYKYRTFDGTCNNLQNPLIGAIVTPYSRLLPATYDDNVLEERRSVSGSNLKSARAIVDTLFAQPRTPGISKKMLPNMGFFIFSQFITHDVAGQINTHHRSNTDEPIRCCSADYKKVLPKSLSHFACAPIIIPTNDKFYSKKNIGCHNFIRSQPIFPTDCKLSAAQQANRATGYIDLSPVYGTTAELSWSLRTLRKGLLKTNRNDVLPVKKDCVAKNCYFAGDFRVNQTPHLALMHSLFFRLHNQIAKTLCSVNTHWDDERLYQEARRINIALMQHIVYEEFLPVLLGESLSSCGEQTDYNATIMGTTMNDFTTGVYRYLHAYTPTNFETYDEAGNRNGAFQVSKIIEDTRILETNFDDVARGLVYQGINLVEPYNDEVRNRLFNDSDLISVDIQRGRDHGLAPYWQYRELCGLPPIEKFSDLYPLISEQNIQRLQNIYESPHDIDLIIGGGIEKKDGGLLGPTFKYISKIQFSHYKMGDRFFYSHRRSGYPFTSMQLKEIKQFSFAKLLCLTTSVENVPINGFFVPNKGNILVSCSKLRKLDLLPWID